MYLDVIMRIFDINDPGNHTSTIVVRIFKKNLEQITKLPVFDSIIIFFLKIRISINKALNNVKW